MVCLVAAYEGHVGAEFLEPGEQPVQRGLIGQPAVQDGLGGCTVTVRSS